ncbi:Dabb family protein [Nocardioides sp. W7]|uniref:Dabb family protein n=1 Tax=Nocardioides sp. W7 TaxID=2931390 RepID=UPI001FD0BB70|nr:Dabb family protein [Nocardioides sp. W7]
MTLVPDSTEEQVEAILEGLLALPGLVDGLVEAQVVRDAGLAEGNAALRFQMVFDSQASWWEYGSHPAHLALIGEHIKPVLAAKAFVQFDDSDVRRSTAEPS